MMNDETNQFERRLSRQPLRPIPPDWRREILAAAESASRPAPRAPHPAWLATFNQQLSTLFWPHPKAWAGLAAVWVLIFAMNFSIHETAPRRMAKAAPPSPEVIVELKKQQRMFAELVGANEPLDADRPRIFAPKPHGERAEILRG